mmetsp:Transcript_8872/g.22314  ORF Transcript_8872/g.22314 Transcript_8872/m.22314 type:complete len:279 (-) Transcript_8872:272-1108(-)
MFAGRALGVIQADNQRPISGTEVIKHVIGVDRLEALLLFMGSDLGCGGSHGTAHYRLVHASDAAHDGVEDVLAFGTVAAPALLRLPQGVQGEGRQAVPVSNVDVLVCLVVGLALKHRVAHSKPFQLPSRCRGGGMHDALHHGRHIHSGIRLASEPEVTARKFRILLQETVNEGVVVCGGLRIVCMHRPSRILVGEPHARGLVHKHHVGNVHPRYVARRQSPFGRGHNGAVLLEESGAAAAARAALEPHHQRVCCRAAAAGKEVVEYMLPSLNVNVARA